MEKMRMHSPNLTQENIARIRELFPGCVTEAKDKDGTLKLAVDFDQLRQELSESIVEGPQERYHLNWPGKREALLTANAPIAKTLRPCREESVDFDTTRNLFIEGDNLDALKLLQETYLGKVKMIYIDPPYNTGNDFIYQDDFAENTEEFLKRSNQKDEEGNRLVSNQESNGRFHSDWLSMMYPRLKLARNLLSDDGVIFISIDDNEVANLRKLCDEIYGADSFVAEFVWKSKLGKVGTTSTISATHEYVICYAKQISEVKFKMIEKESEGRRENLRQWGQADRREDRPSMFYPIKINGVCVYPIKEDGNDGRWRVGKKSAEELLTQGLLELVDKDGVYSIYRNFPPGKSLIPYDTLLLDDIGTSAKGSLTLKTLELQKFFDYPKSVELNKFLAYLTTTNNDVVLDFFAGSSTTAHAVMQLNAEDGGNRKFIMVQLPEPCDERSEAFKAGYKTIAEISKERIRRAGKKIRDELAAKRNEDTGLFDQDCEKTDLDIGFRVLKVDSSNMAEVFYRPDEYRQDMLAQLEGNVKPERSSEDLLFQVLLDWGVDLSLPIRKTVIQDKTVFFVDENALVACFDTGVDENLVRELAQFRPVRVVFRDTGFASDAVKINVEQIFKQLSPGTDVKSI